MASFSHKHPVLGLAALQLFPPSIRESLVSDSVFRKSYGFTADAQISFGEEGASVQRSKLFDCIRQLLTDPSARTTLNDGTGKECRLELIEIDNKRRIGLSRDERRLLLPDSYALSPHHAERVESFNRDANEVNLPEQATNGWHKILTSRPVSDEELGELHKEITETPIRVAAMIGSEMETAKVNLSTLVPRSERYFDRLAGEYGQSPNISDHAEVAAREHINQLMSWRAYDGFLLSLLLSSHSSIAAAIDANQLEERDLIQAYEWIEREGDPISQVGAIEIGLSILDKSPKIEPYIRRTIEQIRDDSADRDRGRFHLLSSLIMLVEGELSRTKILRRNPPFWRRLASIAQASLIWRCVIKSNIDITKFIEWALQARSQHFYLQTMVDLRLEPRWLPDYISPRQLKAELIGRIVSAAGRNDARLHTAAIRELLLGDSPESLPSFTEFPGAYLPGPLEGGLEAQIEPPAKILRAIEEQLSADVLQPHSFTALVNSALLFRLESHHAQLAAKALRVAKHEVRHADSKEQLFSVLSGLATVAAATRSGELAEELRTITRRWRHEAGRGLSADEALSIGLVSAAAHPCLTAWCEFLGEWITELAFQSLRPDEMKALHSHVEQLCHIVPELWCTCGRAEAALRA